MIRFSRLAIAVLLLSINGCHSAQVTAQASGKAPAEIAAAAKPAPSQPPPMPFSLFISASGGFGKPQDSFAMDTAHMMTVKTNHQGKDGSWRPLQAFALLDPQDFDTLSTIVHKGNLMELDSSDVTTHCENPEYYRLAIIPLEGNRASAAFESCAVDYNLLLQPQRKYFKLLIEWFERMRVKYRPNQPE